MGVDQLGYEKELGMTPSVMKNDKSWRGMLLKDNDGDWGVAVAAWRGMKKGQAGIPGKVLPVYSQRLVRQNELKTELKNLNLDRKSFN